MSLITILRKWLRTMSPSFVACGSSVPPEPQRLEPGQSVCFDDASGGALDCLAGSLWITHDGDPKDVIVQAGETYQVASRKRLIVHALGNSELRMR